jgi:SAM-dependent methyltransferase
MVINKIMDLIFENSRIFDKVRDLIHKNFIEQRNLISKNFNKNKKTLDFGCGIGQFSNLFNPSFYTGVDTDHKYINFCNKNRQGKFLKINFSPPYPLKKNTFDQIMMSLMIHHLDDKTFKRITNELHTLLSSSGNLMIIDHLTISKQPSLFCKLLVFLDRGKHFRNKEPVINLLKDKYDLKKSIMFKNGPYLDYLLIFKKNT